MLFMQARQVWESATVSCNKDWSFVGSFFGFVGQERFTVKGFDFVDDGGNEVFFRYPLLIRLSEHSCNL